MIALRWTMLLALLLLAGTSQGRAAPQDSAAGYPARPVRVIVPFAPGGVTDVMGRLLAQKLSERLGKEFYVDNRAGAGGNIGTGVAAAAAADGYTLLLTSSSYVVNPSLHAKIPYDPNRDLVPITIAAVSPNLLVINPSVPARTVQELVDYIRKNPGLASFASAGIGTTPHLSGEMFRLSLGLDMVHVPFGGAGPALQSALAGHTPIAFTALPPAVPLVIAGELRALAVTSAKRSPALPDVPTMAEAGLHDQEVETILPILVPAATPKPIIDLLYGEIARIIALPDTQQTLATLGFDPLASTPEQSAARVKEELARWAKVIRDAKIEPQ
jgi:tripartite-type tricarboxylate transporter receptor subunit TctC